MKSDAPETSSAQTILGGMAFGAFIILLSVSPGIPKPSDASLQDAVVPPSGVALPVAWGDLGAALLEAGVIDQTKLEALYQDAGGLPNTYQRLLERGVREKIVMTEENAGHLLNLFWALGLANRNPILEDQTEMMNPAYGGAGNFASTGGWTIAKGDAMQHYNMHALVLLTAEEQTLVDRVSRGVYRPCCGNSTHFPDCNHGMAMLGLLELMASEGASEQDMYDIALAVNSYWFPDAYRTIATYMRQRGISWKDVSPQEMLGADYSGAQGFRNVQLKVNAPEGVGANCTV